MEYPNNLYKPKINNQRVPKVNNQRVPKVNNQRIPKVNNQRVPKVNYQEQITSEVVRSNSGSGFSIFLIIFFVIILIGLLYFAYKYITSPSFQSFFGAPYYMVKAEEEENKKAQCKSGCNQGKCTVKSGNECKSDNDCQVCVDNKGGFYGTVPSTSSTSKEDESKRKIKILEEEDAIQDRKIQDLEKMIAERNKQIAELNRYIEYLNRKEKRRIES